MEREKYPASADCREDATVLICGLIRELSSLKLGTKILLFTLPLSTFPYPVVLFSLNLSSCGSCLSLL